MDFDLEAGYYDIMSFDIEAGRTFDHFLEDFCADKQHFDKHRPPHIAIDIDAGWIPHPWRTFGFVSSYIFEIKSALYGGPILPR